MKKATAIVIALTALFPFLSSAQSTTAALAHTILTDERLDTVQARALRLLSGFSAGSSYQEVWIRDFNTFIKGSLAVHPKEKVKERLLMFFKIQGSNGNIVDGVVDSATASGGYQYRYSSLLPGWAAHKNTVETDQESSLIQAVKKYIDVTGDRSILNERIGNLSVLRRMENALAYVRKNRWSKKYGLVTGATTIDWGDVQPERGWGVAINEHTHWAIDIYDNAMYAAAIRDFLAYAPRNLATRAYWQVAAKALRAHVRRYLWDPSLQKYKPHLYLAGSPFNSRFNEQQIVYLGGSICAMLAGFNTPGEVRHINQRLVAVAHKEPFATVGITIYPPYPAAEFPNMQPYTYQNGGDWTWFGGRIAQVLLANGQARDAYDELAPMIDRVITNKGFFEWYDVRSGMPKGSGDFRGEAGVLYDAIRELRAWAAAHEHR